MSNPLCNNQMELVRLISEYEPKIHGLFDYLNGKINPRNICVYNLGYFSANNYAQFQYPNIMTIFIGSIVDYFYSINDDPITRHNKVMSISALCIAHELYHADQLIDANKYTKDDNYRCMVEDAAEYNAELYCATHIKEFKSLFGFTYNIVSPNQSDFSATKTTRVSDETMLDYLYCAVLGTFRSPDIANEIKSMYHLDNLAIALYWNGKFIDVISVKENGQVILTVDDIVRVLSKAKSQDQATRSFNMRVTEYDKYDVHVYCINVISYTYNAFI